MAKYVNFLFLILLHQNVAGRPMSEMEASKELKSLSQNFAKFNFKLFKLLAKDSQNANTVYSSYSLGSVLALASLGAKGETLEEIKNTLGLPEKGELTRIFSELASKLTSNENYTLKSAHGVFPSKDMEYNSEFAKDAADHFKAEVRAMNFGEPETAVEILNEWIRNQTEGKILQLFSKDIITPDVVMVLANGVYFKGDWLTKFDPKKTKEEDFQVTPERKIRVPTMEIETYMGIGLLEGATVAELPYKGNRLSMFIIVPDEVGGIDRIFDKVLCSSQLNFEETFGDLFKSNKKLFLPKFKLESYLNLNDQLSALGMSKMFSDQADFSGIAGVQGDIYVSSVIQKSVIEVNEEGSEAAAASGMTMMMRSMPMPSEPLRVDRPFGFFILDKLTGLVLFSGKVTDPSSS